MKSFKKTHIQSISLTILFGILYDYFYFSLYSLFFHLFLSIEYSIYLSLGFMLFNIILGEGTTHIHFIHSNDDISNNDKKEIDEKYIHLFHQLKEKGEKTSHRIRSVQLHFLDKEKYSFLFLGSPAANINNQIYYLGKPTVEEGEFCAFCSHELGHSATLNFSILKLFQFTSFLLSIFKKNIRMFTFLCISVQKKSKKKGTSIFFFSLSILFLSLYFLFTLPEILFLMIPHRMEEYKADEFCVLCGYGEWLKQFLWNHQYETSFTMNLLDSFEHPLPKKRMKRICQLENLPLEYIDYIFDEQGHVLVKYLGKQTKLVIPSFVEEIGNGRNAISHSVKHVNCAQATIIHSFAFASTQIEFIEGKDIQVIENKSFFRSFHLKEAIFPSVMDIHSCAFLESGIEQVIVSSSLVQMEDFAFANCKKLREIKGLDWNHIEKISGNCFSNDSLLEDSKMFLQEANDVGIEIPNGTIYVSNDVIKSNNSITKCVYVPSTVRFMEIHHPTIWILNRSLLTFKLGISVSSEEELLQCILQKYPYVFLFFPLQRRIESIQPLSFQDIVEFYKHIQLSYSFTYKQIQNESYIFVLNFLAKESFYTHLFQTWIENEQIQEMTLAIFKDHIDEVSFLLSMMEKKKITIHLIEIEKIDFKSSFFIKKTNL